MIIKLILLYSSSNTQKSVLYPFGFIGRKQNISHGCWIQWTKESDSCTYLQTIVRDWRSHDGDCKIMPSCEKWYRVVWQNVKWPRYRSSVAQRVGRDRALLFHDRGTRRRWVFSSTLRPHITPRGKTRYTHCTGGWVGPRGRSGPAEILVPIQDRPVRSQSLYRQFDGKFQKLRTKLPLTPLLE